MGGFAEARRLAICVVSIGGAKVMRSACRGRGRNFAGKEDGRGSGIMFSKPASASEFSSAIKKREKMKGMRTRKPHWNDDWDFTRLH